MKNAPFILLLLGVSFIWLGLTGRLGAVLAAIFEPGALSPTNGDGGKVAPVVVPPEGNAEPAAPEEPTTPETPSAPEIPEIPSPFDIIPGADVFPAA